MESRKIFDVTRERSMTKRERFIGFEDRLKFLLYDINADREDFCLVDDIKQSIIVFVMRDDCKEDNRIFLENVKNDFYDAIEKLEKKHKDISSKIFYIKLFMEDFYFNNKETI